MSHHRFTQPFAEVPFSVAFELNFSAANASDDFKKYCDHLQKTSPELVHRKSKETVTRIYLPPQKSILKDGGTFFMFPKNIPEVQDKMLFFRFMFKREDPRTWMAVARFGEQKCFGFSMDAVPNKSGGLLDWNHYLPLAFPGKSETFVPAFIKLRTAPEEFLYLQIGAGFRGEGVIIGMRIVDMKKEEVPPHLLSEMPKLGLRAA